MRDFQTVQKLVAAVLITISYVALSPAARGSSIPTVDLGTAQAMERDCLEQLSAPKGDVACEFPTIMEPVDRAAIAKITRNEFKDARCMIRVKLARKVVDEALAIADGRIKIPAQAVDCVLETINGEMPVGFCFAPVVDFKAGRAIVANPGMGEVTGVNTWLAWPVVTYVNGNKDIRQVMLRVINAFIERQRQQRAANP